jgi:hypothetical protein
MTGLVDPDQEAVWQTTCQLLLIMFAISGYVIDLVSMEWSGFRQSAIFRNRRSFKSLKMEYGSLIKPTTCDTPLSGNC